jgi:DNA-binding MarR family transcriptional regulator
MEKLLIEFINTFDLSLKKTQLEASGDSGFSILTIHQLQYINAIDELGNPTITQLANKLSITKASVTAGVNKLIDLGYAAKKQAQDDRRVFRVSLTVAGRQLTKAKYQALKEYGEFITSALSKDEARQLEAILTKLVKLFQQS